jgi:hypothetical protein
METMVSGTIEKTIINGVNSSSEKIIANLAQSSVELAMNSKGQTQIAVKVYGQTVEEAEKIAVETYDRLSAKYNKGATG